MAWKLKRSKSTADEELSPTTTDTVGGAPNGDHDYSNTVDGKSVMVLSDDDFDENLIPKPHIPAAPPVTPTAQAETDSVFEGASDEELSRYLRGNSDNEFSSPFIDLDAQADEPDTLPGDDNEPVAPVHPVDLDEAAEIAHFHEIDLDDEPNFLESAVSASDDAVASLDAAKGGASPHVSMPEPDEQASSVHDPSWGDAFAPYQPSVTGSPATSPPLTVAEDAGAVAGATGLSRLVVRLGHFSASYEVAKAEITIGRPDPRVQVFPDVSVEWDDAVSRHHARVTHRADGDWVEDLGSTNGTRLNGKLITAEVPVLLSDGDKIQVGEKTEITYFR